MKTTKFLIMKKLILAFFLLSFYANAQNTYPVIPKPNSLVEGKGKFSITPKTKIVVSTNAPETRKVAEQLAQRIQIVTGNLPEITSQKTPNSISFEDAPALGPEAYEFVASPASVIIKASTAKGHFYGFQTLLQLLPPSVYSSSLQPAVKLAVPECIIKDEPRFGYRGMMLDLGRHYFPVSFIKKYIDLIAMHKLNTFHMHLTDDQGWRIEIKKYPKLIEIGSKRKESMAGHYRDQKWDGIPHEGFYTQDEIRDIVKYAESKFVTAIPEIELPGHAQAALAAYPELGCENKKYEVSTLWGVSDQVFCPNEQTFEFLQNVLTEVMELFPSKYIHIGGDECPKTAWKNSEFCQQLMKKEGLKDEHELQSYFIRRIDKFVTSKGRKIIGWDEILEGGISPNATIMSWRGIEGGIDAAKQGHDAIMTPTSNLYLDYYQSNPLTEPIAIGGYLTIEKVYGYEPVPAALTKEQAKHILGTQANLWTEYIATPEHAEYMAFPRASALAEVAWTKAELKDYKNFALRLKTHFERLKHLGVNYARSYYDITASTLKDAKGFPVVKLENIDKDVIIRYTLDGTEPNAQSLAFDPAKNIPINADMLISSAAFSKTGDQLGKVLTKQFVVSLSTGKTYTLADEPQGYTGGEKYALTNAIVGDLSNSSSWVGFNGKDLDAVIDLGQRTLINRIGVAFQRASASWIMLPRYVEIFISEDGKTFKSVKRIEMDTSDKPEYIVQQLNIALGTQNARYIKVFAKNYGKLADSHPGHGNPAWLFVDEISVK